MDEPEFCLPRLLIFRPHVVEIFYDQDHAVHRGTDVLAGDHQQAFPCMRGIVANVEFRSPEEGVIFKPTPDGFLESRCHLIVVVAASSEPWERLAHINLLSSIAYPAILATVSITSSYAPLLQRI